MNVADPCGARWTSSWAGASNPYGIVVLVGIGVSVAGGAGVGVLVRVGVFVFVRVEVGVRVGRAVFVGEGGRVDDACGVSVGFGGCGAAPAGFSPR